MKILRTSLLVVGLFLATGCVYRINIQQGNFLKQTDVDQVQAGMTRSQVRYLLGTPMVADSFNKERWDYIYYLKKGRTRHVDSRRVTVYFDGDKVTRLEKPSAAIAAQQDASAAKIKNGRTSWAYGAALGLPSLDGTGLLHPRAPCGLGIEGERSIDLHAISRLERLLGACGHAEHPDPRAFEVGAPAGRGRARRA